MVSRHKRNCNLQERGRLREVVRWLPLEKILLETDSPFLAPIPFRGKPNKPAHIPAIATFVAELKNISLQQLAEHTNENAQRLFKLPDESRDRF